MNAQLLLTHLRRMRSGKGKGVERAVVGVFGFRHTACSDVLAASSSITGQAGRRSVGRAGERSLRVFHI